MVGAEARCLFGCGGYAVLVDGGVDVTTPEKEPGDEVMSCRARDGSVETVVEGSVGDEVREEDIQIGEFGKGGV